MAFYGVELSAIQEIHRQSGIASLPASEFGGDRPSVRICEVDGYINAQITELVRGKGLPDSKHFMELRPLSWICWRYFEVIRPEVPPAYQPALDRVVTAMSPMETPLFESPIVCTKGWRMTEMHQIYTTAQCQEMKETLTVCGYTAMRDGTAAFPVSAKLAAELATWDPWCFEMERAWLGLLEPCIAQGLALMNFGRAIAIPALP